MIKTRARALRACAARLRVGVGVGRTAGFGRSVGWIFKKKKEKNHVGRRASLASRIRARIRARDRGVEGKKTKRLLVGADDGRRRRGGGISNVGSHGHRLVDWCSRARETTTTTTTTTHVDTRRRAYKRVRRYVYARGHTHDARRRRTTHDARRGDSRAGGLKFKSREQRRRR